MYQVISVNAFRDNYIWLLIKDNKCAVVDPGEAHAVLDYVARHQLIITDILLTHHHPDHTGGVSEIQRHFPQVHIYAPDSARFAMATRHCNEQMKIDVAAGIVLEVVELHGHTSDHIGYLDQENEQNKAFVGDTLFSGGCGRLFEGTPEQMQQSLQKLSQLGKDTKVYCAHEYTQANLAFAQTVEANNQVLLSYIEQVEAKRQQGEPTIPTTIATELAINPFLRAEQIEIKQTLKHEFSLSELPNDSESFALLRKWKDNF